MSQHPYPGHPTLDRDVSLLRERGVDIDLVAMGRSFTFGRVQSPRLRLYSMRQVQRRTPAFWYAIQYLTFLLWAFAVVSVLSLSRRYDAVEVDNMPDVLVFATIVPRLRRIPIVLFILDLMPEMTMDRLGVSARDRRVRFVAWLEGRAVQWANRVITVSELFRRALVRRGLDPAVVTIVANAHPMVAFPPRNPPASPLLIMQTSFIYRYGVDVALQAMPMLVSRWPQLRFRLLGQGSLRDSMIRLAESLGVRERVSFSEGLLPWRDAMNEIRQATLGIVAIRSDAYGDLIMPNKLLELVALDVPVVCSRVRGIQEHFPESTLAYFEPENPLSLAAQVDRLLADPKEASRQAERARVALEPLSWEQGSLRYLQALGVEPAISSGGRSVAGWLPSPVRGR